MRKHCGRGGRGDRRPARDRRGSLAVKAASETPSSRRSRRRWTSRRAWSKLAVPGDASGRASRRSCLAAAGIDAEHIIAAARLLVAQTAPTALVVRAQSPRHRGGRRPNRRSIAAGVAALALAAGSLRCCGSPARRTFAVASTRPLRATRRSRFPRSPESQTGPLKVAYDQERPTRSITAAALLVAGARGCRERYGVTVVVVRPAAAVTTATAVQVPVALG